MLTMLVASIIAMGLSVPSTAIAKAGPAKPAKISAWASFACPGYEIIAQRVNCTQGEWFWAEGVCPDGKTVRMVTQCSAASTADESFIRRIVGEEFAKRFRWGVGLGVNQMGAEDPGPASPDVEGWLFGDLSILESQFFLHLEGSAGLASVRSTYPAVLGGFVGVRFPELGMFSLTVGGRDKVAFLQKKELLNSLMGEAQLRFRMSESTSFLLKGSYGRSWFPYMGPAEGFYPAGAVVPLEKKPGIGPVGSFGAGIELRF